MCYIINFSMSFMSRDQHLCLNKFYTQKNLTLPVLIIFLPIFDVFIHKLDTVTGRDITNPTIVFCIFYTQVGHNHRPRHKQSNDFFCIFFIHKLDTITGRDITNPTIFFAYFYTQIGHNHRPRRNQSNDFLHIFFYKFCVV